MSTRCRNDLTGCKSRINSLLNSWRESRASVEEVWNDATARSYYSENFSDTEEMLLRMGTALQEAADTVRAFERAMAESDDHYRD